MPNSQSLQVHFLPDDVTVSAQPGEPMLEVAGRAGVTIPTGCLMGSCHACEVEIDGEDVICACISAVPAGRDKITINIAVDPTW
ncbi:2Fe-2S iron-sulfur cluster-binding protein [Capilliphycus salinus ALCB114379]|uniref:2Fe-2S iron-sulfur cluster-binding protein n=1 Tax=Capilliphycus salinus TaxID=2768948 RepID=UPI0039A57BEE